MVSQLIAQLLVKLQWMSINDAQNVASYVMIMLKHTYAEVLYIASCTIQLNR